MSTPPPKPVRLEAPDASYRLTPEQRANLAPGMEAEAVEHLLRWILPNERESMLANFSRPPRPQYVPGRPYRVSNQTIVAFNDPVLQAALEAIWAPIWAKASDIELMRQGDAPLPGLATERRKRHLASEGSEKQP